MCCSVLQSETWLIPHRPWGTWIGVLQGVAVCCSVLRCVWTWGTKMIPMLCQLTLFFGNPIHCSNTLQHTATHCNTLQHIATHCNTLQHTATHCNTLQHTATHNTLHHTATHCNTLQHTATHCNTLPDLEVREMISVPMLKNGSCLRFLKTQLATKMPKYNH